MPTKSAQAAVRDPRVSRRIRPTLLGLTGGVASIALLLIVGTRAGVLPPLPDAAASLPAFLTDAATYADVVSTLSRVVLGLGLTVVTGLPASLAVARGGLVAAVLDHYVSFALAIPSTIAALISVFVFRGSEVGIVLVVWFITWPYFTSVLAERIKASDTKLAELANVYGFRRVTYLRHVLAPEVFPYTVAAIRNEHAHAWKVVVLAELFAAAGGMGARFSRAFDRFVLVDTLLWLTTFIVIFLAVEYGILRPVEARANKWQMNRSDGRR